MPQNDPMAYISPDDTLPPGDGMPGPDEMGQIDINDPRAQEALKRAYQPNEQVGRILTMRVDGLSQPEIMALDQAITPQNGPVFLKLFPELAPLIQMASSLAGMQQGGGAPAPQPGPMPAPAAPAPGGSRLRDVPIR